PVRNLMLRSERWLVLVRALDERPIRSALEGARTLHRAPVIAPLVARLPELIRRASCRERLLAVWLANTGIILGALPSKRWPVEWPGTVIDLLRCARVRSTGSSGGPKTGL